MIGSLAPTFGHLDRAADATCDNQCVREREDIEVEHQRLRREVDALRAEHLALERKPVDSTEHRAHRARLKAQIEKLHAHAERLRSTRSE